MRAHLTVLVSMLVALMAACVQGASLAAGQDFCGLQCTYPHISALIKPAHHWHNARYRAYLALGSWLLEHAAGPHTASFWQCLHRLKISTIHAVLCVVSMHGETGVKQSIEALLLAT